MTTLKQWTKNDVDEVDAISSMSFASCASASAFQQLLRRVFFKGQNRL